VAAILAGTEWRAHHLINVAAMKAAPALFAAALRAGRTIDGPPNTAALPKSAAAQAKLREAGVHRPIHYSGHPDWNRIVKAELIGIETILELRLEQVTTASQNEAARKALESLSNELFRSMMQYQKITSSSVNNNERTT
jgi:hypothetical protein